MIRGRVLGRFDDAEIGAFVDAVLADERRLVGAVAGARAGAAAGAEAYAGAEVGAGDDGGAARPRADDVFAGAVWSTLAESGDAVAGILRLAFGEAGSLEVLRESDADIERRLAELGVVDVERLGVEAARARWQPRVTEARLRAALRGAVVLGAQLIVPGSPFWPAGLDDLGANAPCVLWARGDVAALTARPAVAVVGCRASSAYGEHVAADLSSALVARGFAVHSGGAYGIDAMAHRAALAAEGTTVAVLAGGIDRLYPAGNHDLLTRVIDRGAVVSESPCGTPPTRHRFLQRNRLLAAITAGTVVVEAGHRSGALNTAGHARALERPVGAVPGPITSPASAGCHRWLRDGTAVCITCVDDVLELVSPSLPIDGTATMADDDARGDHGRAHAGTGVNARRPGDLDGVGPDELRVLDALSERRARTDDEVAAASGLSPSDTRGALAALELAGRVREDDAGWLRRRVDRSG